MLSYQTQQHKLFPLLATAYAFNFVQETMINMYNEVNAKVAKGDFSQSQDVSLKYTKLVEKVWIDIYWNESAAYAKSEKGLQLYVVFFLTKFLLWLSIFQQNIKNSKKTHFDNIFANGRIYLYRFKKYGKINYYIGKWQYRPQ